MKTTQNPHLGQSVALAVVLALMSIGVIALMTVQSHIF